MVVEIEDFDGSKVIQEYNVLNKPEKIVDQAGRETRLTYDKMWNVNGVTEPNGATTKYRYSRYNYLRQIENAKGATITYRYDVVGNRTEMIDEEGNSTSFAYDVLNRLVKVTDANGGETAYTYDAQGQVTKVVNALGHVVTLAYDVNGNLIKETGPLGETRSYIYTGLGKIEKIIDERGLEMSYVYAVGGRVQGIVYPDGQRESYTYDKVGHIQSYTNREGYVLTYIYDVLGQVTQIEGNDGAKKSFTYDAKGNVTSFVDEKGQTTAYTYSVTGALVGVKDALGNETSYTYDERDRLIEVRQGSGEAGISEEVRGVDEDLKHVKEQNKTNNILSITRYERDLLGNVTEITDALGNKEKYNYNQKSQLIEKVDKEGYLTTYEYQSTGEVGQIQYADGKEVRLSYNALRQLEEIEDWLGITRIQTDARGRATKVSYPDGKEVSYGYGLAGERLEMVYPNGSKVSYGYDSLYRLSSVTDEVGTTKYRYNEKGKLEQKSYPNGMETLYGYTEKGRLASFIHQDEVGVLDAYKYSYDIQGNKVEIEKTRRGVEAESGVYGYGYDELQRLMEVRKDGSILRSYRYDALGNRSQSMETGKTRSHYVYNALNQLISKVDMGIEGEQRNGSLANEERYSYDKRGNLTEVIKNGNLVNQYHFGALNRLEKAVNHESGEASIYQYNGLGHRVGRTVGASIEPMLPTDKLEQLTINPTKQIEDTIDLTKQYHNLLQRTEGSNITAYTWDSNVLHVVVEGTSSSYQYLRDELGSPIRLIDEDDIEQEVYGYDEFGEEILGNNQVYLQPFTYTGYQRDDVTNTYFAQAREYSAKMGRFTGEDSHYYIRIRDVRTINKYVYCMSNSMNRIDPDGFDSYVFYDPEDFPDAANSERRRLEKKYNEDVHMIPIETKEEFQREWNGITDGNVDEISLLFHGQPHALILNEEKREYLTTNNNGITNRNNPAMAISSLDATNQIEKINIWSCNTGHLDHANNVATSFLETQNVGAVVSSDGSLVYNKQYGIRDYGFGLYVPGLAFNQVDFKNATR